METSLLSLKRLHKQDEFELKQEQIESLKQLEDSEFIDLYFDDESHFGLTPNVPYAWQAKENPILLPTAKGRFLNVVRLMNCKNKLFVDVLESTFNKDKLICFMDNFVAQTIKMTIVILDNSPIHRSKKFKARIQQWRARCIYFLFTSIFTRIEFDRNIVAKN